MQIFLKCFSSENVLLEREKPCLKINGKQSVKLRSGSTKFKNYFEKLALLFKIYINFECLKVVESNEKIILHILKNIKIIFLALSLTKLYVLMIDLVNELFFIEER